MRASTGNGAAPLWIGGEWADTGQYRDSINPATDEVIGQYVMGTGAGHTVLIYDHKLASAAKVAAEAAGGQPGPVDAADDADAKAAVLDLLSGSGLRGLGAGKLADSRLLERLCAFGIELNQRYSTGVFGFKFLPRSRLAEPPEAISA